MAEGVVTVNPNKVKAAFLRNFARYVIWPDAAFLDGSAPWHVCILGPDPFGEILEATFIGRKEKERLFVLHRAETLQGLSSCQIVFIGYKNAEKRRAALNQLMTQTVLTVSDASDFLQEGGIVRFNVSNRVEISINLDQARSVALTISTKMLEVSREVKENGAVRKWR